MITQIWIILLEALMSSATRLTLKAKCAQILCIKHIGQELCILNLFCQYPLIRLVSRQAPWAGYLQKKMSSMKL